MSSAEMFTLPGFRFHPTDEELLSFYLERKVKGKLNVPPTLILDVEFYNYDPVELSGMQTSQHNHYFFFVPRDRKRPNGSRPNRITPRGYWKATGSDTQIKSSDTRREIGLKKTLVFYEGRAPRGRKTNWIMNEFRLGRTDVANSNIPKECDVTLCRMYRKTSSSSSNSSVSSLGLRRSSSGMFAESMVPSVQQLANTSMQGSPSPCSSPALTPPVAVSVEAKAASSSSHISGYNDDHSEASLEHFFHNHIDDSTFKWLGNDEVQSRMNMKLEVPERDPWQLSPGLILTPNSITAMFLMKSESIDQ